MPLTCSNCGNTRNFLVKTLQMHVVHLDDSRVEVLAALFLQMGDRLLMTVEIGKVEAKLQVRKLLQRRGGRDPPIERDGGLVGLVAAAGQPP